jgi:hypothetical protein
MAMEYLWIRFYPICPQQIARQPKPVKGLRITPYSPKRKIFDKAAEIS